jgi:hypothetical protein|tara:strand:+ start:27 stop:266 length:240 start_codon:yes stop_codon:yes gene_type:complete
MTEKTFLIGMLVFMLCIVLYEKSVNKKKLNNERCNSKDSIRVNQKKKDIECCSKVSEDKTQCKCKPESIKDKAKTDKRK